MLKGIFTTFANCFKIPELKSRIFFTLMILVVCRVVSMIPIPGLDGAALADYFDKMAKQAEGPGLLGMYACSPVVRWSAAALVHWASCPTSPPRSSFS